MEEESNSVFRLTIFSSNNPKTHKTISFDRVDIDGTTFLSKLFDCLPDTYVEEISKIRIYQYPTRAPLAKFIKNDKRKMTIDFSDKTNKAWKERYLTSV